jgi:hypothetical protein
MQRYVAQNNLVEAIQAITGLIGAAGVCARAPGDEMARIA